MIPIFANHYIQPFYMMELMMVIMEGFHLIGYIILHIIYISHIQLILTMVLKLVNGIFMMLDNGF